MPAFWKTIILTRQFREWRRATRKGGKSCHLRVRTVGLKLFHHLQAKHSMAGVQFEGLHTKPALGLTDDIGQASVIEG